MDVIVVEVRFADYELEAFVILKRIGVDSGKSSMLPAKL